MTSILNNDKIWADVPMDVSKDADNIWDNATVLRGVYMPEKYGDVVIPMTVLRRIECTIAPTKQKVVDAFAANPNIPEKVLYEYSKYPFYCTSPFTLKEICNDPAHMAENLNEYIDSFSPNIKQILKELDLKSHIRKMEENSVLFSLVNNFVETDLAPEHFSPMRMGYIFENLVSRFYENVDAGQFYTGRDIIKMLVGVLVSEGCEDIYEDHKIITVCDQACGTGGMLWTAHSFLKGLNPTADVRLFGQEFMSQTYAVGLAEMLIMGQKADNFRQADTLKTDCYQNQKMRFVIMNPPFGTPWGGKGAKDGQEAAVLAEFEKGFAGRFGAGLPGKSESQFLFMQSGINKLNPINGRAAIITNGSPLFTGGTSSGESQIRRWLIENDYLEAIIAMPAELFYNTNIPTYAWIISMNKRAERKGKIQLINATSICHKSRKSMGNKRYEFTAEDVKQIINIYTNFAENKFCKIYDSNVFLYREYTIMQPLQRSYGISVERVSNLREKGIGGFYNENKHWHLENPIENLKASEVNTLAKYKANKPTYESIIQLLNDNISDDIYFSKNDFIPVIQNLLSCFDDKLVKNILDYIVEGLSLMDKRAEIHVDKKNNIIYDPETKDSEIVPLNVDIDDYMKKEVLPHIPDAKYFFDEDLTAKKPVVKTGAEIPFTKCFYQYKQPAASEELEAKFVKLESVVSERIKKLFGGV